MRRLPQDHHNSRIRRERDAKALSRLAFLLFSGLVLACGFVFAARQHFGAVQYGYESELLRQERQRLENERQRLLLEKEQASSPSRLESAAREFGLKPLSASQIETRRHSKRTQPRESGTAVGSEDFGGQ